LNKEYYWVEIEEIGTQTLLKLSRVQAGAINTSQVFDRTILRDTSQIGFGALTDVHFHVGSNSILYTSDDGDWHAWGRIRYWTGVEYDSSLFHAVFEFGGGDSYATVGSIPLNTANGVPDLPGVLNGRRSAFERSNGTSGSYNLVLNSTLSFTPTWVPIPDLQSASIDILGGKYTALAYNAGLTRIFRGDELASNYSELIYLNDNAVTGNTVHGFWLTEDEE